MPSRDYLIRQFEEMGYFLSVLLRKILKQKEENRQDQMEAAVQEAILEEINLDLEQIVMLENDAFLELTGEQFTTNDQLEKLADILKILGQEIERSYTLTKANYLKKSLFLFSHIQASSPDFSYDRKIKIQELQELIARVGLTDI